ncbi:MAG: STAS domain-containing protein [Candidatus Eisenbacteria bacterium]
MTRSSASGRRLDFPLSGVLDVASALELQRALIPLAEKDSALRLRCGAVSEVDASAVQLLIALERALLRGGGSLCLEEVSPEVRAALTRAGVARLIATGEEERS